MRMTLDGVAAEVTDKGGHFVLRAHLSPITGQTVRFYGQKDQGSESPKILVGLIRITDIIPTNDGRQHIHFTFLAGPAVVNLEVPR